MNVWERCKEEGHPPEYAYLSRYYAHCGRCRTAVNREYYPEWEARVKAIDPKVHCRRWNPLRDDRRKYHGFKCYKWKSVSADGQTVKLGTSPPSMKQAGCVVCAVLGFDCGCAVREIERVGP